jgi:hypothetical protein
MLHANGLPYIVCDTTITTYVTALSEVMGREGTGMISLNCRLR